MTHTYPLGGYFSLELNEGTEFHQSALHLNAGRYALEYVLKARKYRKVYLPYYICDSVLQPLKRLRVAYDFYHINEHLEPNGEMQPKDDEAVLYVNYYGLKNQTADAFCCKYKNTILDYTQAFYCEKGNKFNSNSIQCDTFYSCRKYFGVPDGAYLYTDCLLDDDLPLDESFERITFLTKRIDRSAQDGYGDFLSNDRKLATVGLRRMSRLTTRLMQSIDYTAKANRRIHNFAVLDKALRESNIFKWNLDCCTVPLVYPYFVENGAKLRQMLIDNQVFCARYWPNVMEWCRPGEWEYALADNLVCLPIDQRYDDCDMKRIIRFINKR